MDKSPSFQQILDVQNQAILMQYLHWCKVELVSYQFWVLLAMLIVPWIVWIKLIDKKRIQEIFIYGLLVVTVVTFFDELGCQLNLWEYKIDIEPYFPRLIPMNFSMLPVVYMLIYQYFPKWKSFLLFNILAAVFFTFIGEPILVAIKIYVLINWKSIYSFPVYIIIAIGLRALTKLVVKTNQNASS
ncbi:MAG: hypothetical protein K0R50_677 [Eubacterium sp.]|jgi:hypothetical protein|nr:hypothetical protein [Eubacterium sp.]